MEPGYSTRNKTKNDKPYIWTAYEWMKEDAESEIITILEFLDVKYDLAKVRRILYRLSQGDKGQPQNYRKGVVGDWINYFDLTSLSRTNKLQERYWEALLREAR
jgi:hypothetical protein